MEKFFQFKSEAVVYEIDDQDQIIAILEKDKVPRLQKGTRLSREQVADHEGNLLEVVRFSLSDGRTFFCETGHIDWHEIH